MLAILCGVWATFGNDIGSSMIFKLLYNAFSRTAWSLALAWIVFACCTDHGGNNNINDVIKIKFYEFDRMSRRKSVNGKFFFF